MYITFFIVLNKADPWENGEIVGKFNSMRLEIS